MTRTPTHIPTHLYYCLGPCHNRLDGITPQLAPGVPRFAVGARAQAARGQGDDLHVGVPADFGEVEAGERGLFVCVCGWMDGRV